MTAGGVAAGGRDKKEHKEFSDICKCTAIKKSDNHSHAADEKWSRGNTVVPIDTRGRALLIPLAAASPPMRQYLHLKEPTSQ